jgi:hypothetical protein
VFAAFQERRGAVESLTASAGLPSTVEDAVRRYLDDFFQTLSSETQREHDIVSACRSPR